MPGLYNSQTSRQFVETEIRLFVENFDDAAQPNLLNFTFNILNVNLDNPFKRLSIESHLIHLFIKAGENLINEFILHDCVTIPEDLPVL